MKKLNVSCSNNLFLLQMLSEIALTKNYDIASGSVVLFFLIWRLLRFFLSLFVFEKNVLFLPPPFL
eukprot:gene1003-596_t